MTNLSGVDLAQANLPQNKISLTLDKVVLILDIDGVIRDVSGSYHRALADTVEFFINDIISSKLNSKLELGKNVEATSGFRPSSDDIDLLKTEGIWNNDWEAAQELIRRWAGANNLVINYSYEVIVEFFQGCYRGKNANFEDGYITSEPLIATPGYFQELTASGVKWGFFSGATRASAEYVLSRLKISNSTLVAMEDAPGKPDPAGLWLAAQKLDSEAVLIIYAGDTAADMLTVRNARIQNQTKNLLAIGILPPHVHHKNPEAYAQMLIANGADFILKSVLELNSEFISVVLGSLSSKL